MLRLQQPNQNNQQILAEFSGMRILRGAGAAYTLPVMHESTTQWDRFRATSQSWASTHFTRNWHNSPIADVESPMRVKTPFAAVTSAPVVNYEDIRTLSVAPVEIYEFLKQLTATSQESYENRQLILSAAAAAWEARLALSSVSPVPWESMLQASTVILMEWESLHNLIAPGAPAWESLLHLALGESINWESLQSAVSSSAAVNYEFLHFITAASQSNIENVQRLAQTLLAEWESGLLSFIPGGGSGGGGSWPFVG